MKVIKIGRDSSAMSVMINGKELKQVEQFKYLGSISTSDGKCSSEITQEWLCGKKGLQKEKRTFNKKLKYQLESADDRH